MFIMIGLMPVKTLISLKLHVYVMFICKVYNSNLHFGNIISAGNVSIPIFYLLFC